MLEYNELTDVDFQILNFLNSKKERSIKDILNKFPDKKFSTNYRLELLITGRRNSSGFYIENTSYIVKNYRNERNEHGLIKSINLDTFSITEKGRVALQTYFLSKTKDRKNFIIQVLPILISIIALLKSFDKEIIYIWQLLMQLLK